MTSLHTAALNHAFFKHSPLASRTGKPSAPRWWLVLLEARAGWEAAASVLAWPILQTAPKGDGHPVMVIPGLGADDHSTIILRHYLTDRGYAVTGWGQGMNRGDSAGVREALVQRLLKLEAASGRAVSLVGWSLGGVFARMLAHQHTRCVHRVVTLGTPFAGDEHGTNAGWAYRLLNGRSPGGLKRSTLGRAATAAARVPTTSIYSRTDGIVSWHNSVAPQQDTLSENIEVHASHLGIGAHPAAMYAVADRLASPISGREWQPFVAPALFQSHFPDPTRP